MAGGEAFAAGKKLPMLGGDDSTAADDIATEAALFVCSTAVGAFPVGGAVFTFSLLVETAFKALPVFAATAVDLVDEDARLPLLLLPLSGTVGGKATADA